MWAAVARASGWLNLFNLLPVWQLDGGRAFRALCRWQRWTAAATLGALCLVTGEMLLLFLAVAAAARALGKSAEKPDNPMLGLYVALAAALSFLAVLPVPGTPAP
jgi:Zn-dependent protease